MRQTNDWKWINESKTKIIELGTGSNEFLRVVMRKSKDHIGFI